MRPKNTSANRPPHRMIPPMKEAESKRCPEPPSVLFPVVLASVVVGVSVVVVFDVPGTGVVVGAVVVVLPEMFTH